MIKMKYRVKSHQDFQKIIHLRRIVKDKAFLVYYTKNTYGHARFGISVSKKRGNAVRRNLIKRQIRHMIDEVVDYSTSLDVIVIVRDGYDVDKFMSNKECIEKLWQYMRRVNNEKDEKMA